MAVYMYYVLYRYVHVCIVRFVPPLTVLLWHEQATTCSGVYEHPACKHKALDTDTGDFVAIERIRVDRIKARQLMRLLTEGHLMEQLQHPHIVSFKGAIETENHIHLILEFVDSGSLCSLVQWACLSAAHRPPAHPPSSPCSPSKK